MLLSVLSFVFRGWHLHVFVPSTRIFFLSFLHWSICIRILSHENIFNIRKINFVTLWRLRFDVLAFKSCQTNSEGVLEQILYKQFPSNFPLQVRTTLADIDLIKFLFSFVCKCSPDSFFLDLILVNINFSSILRINDTFSDSWNLCLDSNPQ